MPTQRFDRLADDFVHATGRHMSLELVDQDGIEAVAVSLDGQHHGSFRHAFPPQPEEFLADVASTLQEVLSQVVWGGWPICPTHRTHPLDPIVIDGVAMWLCPKGAFVTRIGDLGRS